MDAPDPLFPLPDDQLPRVQIDPQTVADWKSEAQEAIHSLLMDRSSWFYRFDQSHPDFSRAYDKNGTQGCMRVLPDTNTVEYLAQGELSMTMEDVVYAMYSETTQEQRVIHAQLYQHICLDSAILQLYEGATDQDPVQRVAMIWTALAPTMSGAPALRSISSARDYLYFDLCCTAKDADGRTVLVNYRKSKDLRPDQLVQDHALGIDRRHTYGIGAYHADRHGRVLMTALGHIALETRFSTKVLKVIMPVIYHRALNHHGLVAAKALRQMGITADTLVDKNSEHASVCRVCLKAFNLLRRRKWCRGCGHAICRDCNMKLALLKDGVLLGPRLPVVPARFCLRCVLRAGEQRIKNEMEHDRFVAEEQQAQAFWWESIRVVDNSSIDGLLELQREHSELSDGDDMTRHSTSSISSSSSALQDEFGMASTKQVHVAAAVDEHFARLRAKHQASALFGPREVSPTRD